MNLRTVTLIVAAAVLGASAAAAPASAARRPAPSPPHPPPRAGVLSIRSEAVARPRSPRVSVIQTSSDLAQALVSLPGLRFAPGAPTAGVPVIRVNDTVRYQQFTGAGAALTDSSAWLIGDELSPPARAGLLRALFGPSGIGLNFLRVPIGASDYTATGVPYTYDDVAAGASDPSLAGFSIAHDSSYILPTLQAIRALDPGLYLEAVPWSPPAWMKANAALTNMGFGGALLPSAYGPLAQYLVRFLQAYAGAGVPVTAIAPQNEPTVAATPGLELSEQQEAAFVTQDLRPALAAAGLSASVFGWDLSWGPLGAADPLIAAAGPATPRVPGQPEPALTGLAWHCYFGSPSVMSRAHYEAPAMQQIVDECSPGPGTVLPTSELLIASLRNWAGAVALWNLALDPAGGPVESPNIGCPGCTGVVTVTESTGTYTFSRDFYELGQLSRFVLPGAVRISSPHFVTYGVGPGDKPVVSPGLDDVAFENPDGTRVLLAYDDATAPVTFAVAWRGSSFTATIPAGATTTFVWR
jgi:glucosylceramidase